MTLETNPSHTARHTHSAPLATSLLGVLMTLLPTATALAQLAPTNMPQDLAGLHAVLKSDASRLQKIAACKRIGAIGTRESVPVLATLLTDPELSHAARIGLEAITDAAAGETLREAIPTVKGQLVVGIVNSLGARREAAAVPSLQILLGSSDAAVASAAAFALGRIANDDAVATLSKAISSTAPPVQTAVGKGCLIAVDQCRRDGRLDNATELCEHMIQSQLPPYIRLAAVRGALLSGKSIDADRLTTLLQSEEAAGFSMGLMVVREFQGDSLIGVVETQWARLSAARQALLITALGDRGDEAALPIVLTATESPDPSVRVAATRSLANFQHDSVCTQLLAMACDSDPAKSKAAREALVLMTGPTVDKAILEQAKDADIATRMVLYELIGRRSISAGVPILVKGADAAEIAERVAAIAGLGRTIPASQLSFLTQRLIAKSSTEEKKAVQAALLACCVRLGDSETCAKEIVACLPATSGTEHLQLYDLLGLIGGPTALEAVAEAAKEPAPEIQDTVTRVLGQWMSPDAAPLLLEIAQSKTEEKYRVRALRGYIRILRQFDMTKRHRIEMCKMAMPLAQRKEERMLMLEALLRAPSRETLQLAGTQLENTEVSHRACEVSLLLSNILAEQQPGAVISAMTKVLATTKDATFTSYAQQLLAKAKQKQQQ